MYLRLLQENFLRPRTKLSVKHNYGLQLSERNWQTVVYKCQYFTILPIQLYPTFRAVSFTFEFSQLIYFFVSSFFPISGRNQVKVGTHIKYYQSILAYLPLLITAADYSHVVLYPKKPEQESEEEKKDPYTTQHPAPFFILLSFNPFVLNKYDDVHLNCLKDTCYNV